MALKRSAEMALSLARLNQTLSYDEETGAFTWRLSTSNRAAPGTRAGSLGRNGYRYIKIDGLNYLEHRLAWFYVNVVWPPNEIDHINQDKADNRIANLRVATRSENMQNVGLRGDNSSGVKGVCWDAWSGRWIAHIWRCGKQNHLGRFDSLEAAAAARKIAEERHYPYRPTST